jgi:hypothetical protein
VHEIIHSEQGDSLTDGRDFRTGAERGGIDEFQEIDGHFGILLEYRFYHMNISVALQEFDEFDYSKLVGADFFTAEDDRFREVVALKQLESQLFAVIELLHIFDFFREEFDFIRCENIHFLFNNEWVVLQEIDLYNTDIVEERPKILDKLILENKIVQREQETLIPHFRDLTDKFGADEGAFEYFKYEFFTLKGIEKSFFHYRFIDIDKPVGRSEQFSRAEGGEGGY